MGYEKNDLIIHDFKNLDSKDKQDIQDFLSGLSVEWDLIDFEDYNLDMGDDE